MSLGEPICRRDINRTIICPPRQQVRKTIDGLIATFCLEHSHALLHCDRDFDPFEDVLGLQVVHPGGSK